MTNNRRSDFARKLSWQEECKAVALFHVNQLKSDQKWTIEQTAKELNRSTGLTAECIMIARWMVTHPRVEQFKSRAQALDYIRRRKREQALVLGDEV